MKLKAKSVLLVCALLNIGTAIQVLGLVELPGSIRTRSQYIHSKPDQFQLVDVDEFISVYLGGVRLELDDYGLGSKRKSGQVTSYFRLGENDYELPRYDSLLISYKQGERLCYPDNLSEWPLKELTRLLEFFNANEKIFKPIDDHVTRRLSIGPIGLLRFVHNNAEAFKLDSKSSDHVNLVENYYFSTELFQLDSQSNCKIVVVLPTRHVKFGENAQVNKTLLSQIITDGHISMVGVFESRKDVQLLNKLSGSELSDPTRQDIKVLERTIVLFNLIHDSTLSIDHHLGHLGSANDNFVTENPLSLPTGSGCGLLLPNREALFVSAKQFSGRFEANNFADQYYVAYDWNSDHLRYDSLGEFKMIYFQGERFVTMISTNEQDLITDQIGSTGKTLEDQAHCAQYKALNWHDKETGKIFAARTMSQVLGVGSQTKLAYLGTKRLEDDLLCYVYEREVTYDQIPVLVLMHSRPNMKRNDRFFLNYYFVLHLQPSEQEKITRHNYESMWLRRITLNSYNEINFLIKQCELTFSQFSWSLDISVDETLEHLEHPARVFDTLECSSQHDQTKVEFVLQQKDESQFSFSQSGEFIRDQFIEQIGSFEEQLSQVIVQKTRIPRSKINQLDVEMHKNTDDLLVRFVLSKPLNFEHISSLIGWILQVESVLRLNQDEPQGSLPAGEILKYQKFMSIEECSLRAVASLGGKQEIHLLHCPQVGCGYIRSFKWAQVSNNVLIREQARNEAPSLDMYARMCSVHLVCRKFSSVNVPSQYALDKLHENLDASLAFSLARWQIDKAGVASPSTALFSAQIKDLTLLASLNHEQWDDQLSTKTCFTIHTKLTSNIQKLKEQLVEVNKNAKIVQLDFDRRHSLRHCHQACLMNQFCKTYTYSSESHQCTLTNFSADLIEEPQLQLSNTLQHKSCKMLSLNQVLRYKQKMVSLVIEPQHLIQGKVPLLVVSLGTCANLCHSNEFHLVADEKNKKQNFLEKHCQSFIYMRSHSLCRLLSGYENHWALTQNLQDNEIELNEHLNGDPASKHGVLRDIKELEHYVGEETAKSVGHCEVFSRDYRDHFFSVRKNIRLKLKQPAGAYTIGSELEASVKIIDKLTLEDCIRECAIIDPECLALDFSVDASMHGIRQPGGTGYVRVCVLYHFRSPFSIEQRLFSSYPANLKLSENIMLAESTQINGIEVSIIEEKVYSPKNPNYTLSLGNSMGWHFYLSGDQLHLKRKLNLAATNNGKQLEEQARELERDRQGSNLTSLEIESVQRQGRKSAPLIMPTFEFMIGIGLGVMAFISVLGIDSTANFDTSNWSSVTQWALARGSNLRSLLTSSSDTDHQSRTTRLVSHIELNEILDGS